eukprot:gene11376-12074_t
MHNLAKLLQDQGKSGEARAMYRRALHAKEKGTGMDHSSTLNTAANLAANLCEAQELVEAEALYRSMGMGYSSTLNTAANLAANLCEAQELVEAEALYRSLGMDHSSTLDIAANLAASLCKAQELVEAEALFRRYAFYVMLNLSSFIRFL